MNKALLQCTTLAVRHSEGWGLEGTTFDLNSGEIILLCGRNGSGKSTLLNALMGLVPSTGRVFVNGVDLSHLPTWARVRQGLAMVPQRAIGFAELSLRQNILLSGVSTTGLENVIDRCGLRSLEHQLLGTLSGGERKRAELARCLALNPLVVLLDEPFAGLDNESVTWLIDLLRNEQKKGVSILISDHQTTARWQSDDRAIVLSNGRMCGTGTLMEMSLKHPFVRDFVRISDLE